VAPTSISIGGISYEYEQSIQLGGQQIGIFYLDSAAGNWLFLGDETGINALGLGSVGPITIAVTASDGVTTTPLNFSFSALGVTDEVVQFGKSISGGKSPYNFTGSTATPVFNAPDLVSYQNFNLSNGTAGATAVSEDTTPTPSNETPAEGTFWVIYGDYSSNKFTAGVAGDDVMIVWDPVGNGSDDLGLVIGNLSAGGVATAGTTYTITVEGSNYYQLVWDGNFVDVSWTDSLVGPITWNPITLA
jgi:hypothetical protein